MTFISKQVNFQMNHQDLERLSHKGVSFDSHEEVLLCWTVPVRTARTAEERYSAVANEMVIIQELTGCQVFLSGLSCTLYSHM